MTKGILWTEEQKQLVIKLWATPDGPDRLVEILKRPYLRICSEATRLGVSRGRSRSKITYYNPKRLPKGVKEGALCPGNGNGLCGKKLFKIRAQNEQGFTTNYFDYFCGDHRFYSTKNEKE